MVLTPASDVVVIDSVVPPNREAATASSGSFQTPNFQPATFSFNETKSKTFVDTVHFFSKIGETIQFEFTDETLRMQAINQTLNCHGIARFRGSLFTEWNLGSLANVPNRKLLLHAKHVLIALKGCGNDDSLRVTIENETLDRIMFWYTNTRGIRREFELCTRDLPIVFDNVKFAKSSFANRMKIPSTLFQAFLTLCKAHDEVQFFTLPNQFVVCTYVDKEMIGKISKTTFNVPLKNLEEYTINKPMRFLVQKRDLNTALSLMTCCSAITDIFFDLDNKPFLVTFTDEHADTQCRMLLSIASAVALDGSMDPQTTTSSDYLATDVSDGSHLVVSQSHPSDTDRRYHSVASASTLVATPSVNQYQSPLKKSRKATPSPQKKRTPSRSPKKTPSPRKRCTPALTPRRTQNRGTTAAVSAFAASFGRQQPVEQPVEDEVTSQAAVELQGFSFEDDDPQQPLPGSYSPELGSPVSPQAERNENESGEDTDFIETLETLEVDVVKVRDEARPRCSLNPPPPMKDAGVQLASETQWRFDGL